MVFKLLFDQSPLLKLAVENVILALFVCVNLTFLSSDHPKTHQVTMCEKSKSELRSELSYCWSPQQ